MLPSLYELYIEDLQEDLKKNVNINILSKDVEDSIYRIAAIITHYALSDIKNIKLTENTYNILFKSVYTVLKLYKLEFIFHTLTFSLKWYGNRDLNFETEVLKSIGNEFRAIIEVFRVLPAKEDTFMLHEKLWYQYQKQNTYQGKELDVQIDECLQTEGVAEQLFMNTWFCRYLIIDKLQNGGKPRIEEHEALPIMLSKYTQNSKGRFTAEIDKSNYIKAANLYTLNRESIQDLSILLEGVLMDMKKLKQMLLIQDVFLLEFGQTM